MNNQLKNALFKQCEEHLNTRLSVIQKTINGLQTSLQSETKSTAGDKHETGRAMVQLEREKAGQQLAQIQNQLQLLEKIKQLNSTSVIGSGSVVLTSGSNYFIAVSVGEITAEGKSFYAISPQTPIAQLLLGKVIGDSIQFRSESFEIQQIF